MNEYRILIKKMSYLIDTTLRSLVEDCNATLRSLVEESGLFIFDAEFAVNGGEDALYLTEGEHTAQQGVAGIVAVTAFIHDAARDVGERHAVVHTHG